MWSQWSDVTGETDPLARFYQVARWSPRPRCFPWRDGRHSSIGRPGLGTLGRREARRRCGELDPRRFGPPAPVDSPAFFADPDGELACLWTPQGGFVDDPQLAAVNLANAARRLGAAFRFRQKVVGIPGDGRVSEVVLASGERVAAEIVVNCAGPWSSQIVEIAGVVDEMGVRTRPLRQEVHGVDAPDGFTVDAGGVCVTDADLGTYFRPTPAALCSSEGWNPRATSWNGSMTQTPTQQRRPCTVTSPTSTVLPAVCPGCAFHLRHAVSHRPTTSLTIGRRSTTRPRDRVSIWQLALAAINLRMLR